MKKIFLFLALLCIASSSFAAPVKIEKAKQLASGFYAHYYLHDNGQAVVKETRVTEINNIVTYYIFNFDPEGFVIMAADDASTLAPRVDGVLFVIRAEATSARVARASLDILHQRNAHVLGIVFNSVRSGSGDYHYYDRYKDYHTA